MTQKDFLLALHNLSKERFDMKEATQNACLSCGECCSDSVQFFKSEIKELKKRYKTFFRGVEIIETSEDSFRLAKKSDINKGSGLNSCVFFSVEDKKCKIYEDRPLICRLYGQSLIASCGYEGSDILPPVSERKELSVSAKEFSLTAMAQMAMEFRQKNQ